MSVALDDESVPCYDIRMQRSSKEEWDALWRGIREVSGFFPDGAIFIGGIAVYLHALAQKLAAGWIEFSHDGDLYISLTDYADLRDIVEVTVNRRLNKHQFVREGVEFDVYVEHNNGLRVPYKDIAAASTVVDGIRVASLEHLLVLKLDAYAARRGSAKGRKDERDLIRIAHMLTTSGVHKERLKRLVTDEMLAQLLLVVQSSEFSPIAADNVKLASKLRSEFVKMIGEIRAIMKQRKS